MNAADRKAANLFLEEQGVFPFLGDHLGSGCSREVYALSNPRYALKFQPDRSGDVDGCCCNQYRDMTYWLPCPNAVEHKVYQEVRGTSAERHLPAIYAISKDHRFLLCERVLPNTWGDDPSHAVDATFRALGIGPWDTGAYNQGCRPSTRDSIYLDTGGFDFHIKDLFRALSGPAVWSRQLLKGRGV